MTHEAIAIFTGKSAETIREQGGTQSWVLNRGHARQCRYVVLCHNAYADWSEGAEPHGSAFLVGRIADVVPSTETKDRWKITLSAYAMVSISNVWRGWRNPVRYTSMDELGIDPSNLDFQEMPKPQETEPIVGKPDGSRKEGFFPLTIAEAKKALAETFGVSPKAIEITIRG